MSTKQEQNQKQKLVPEQGQDQGQEQVRRRGQGHEGRAPGGRQAVWWLVAVAAAFTAAQLLFIGPGLGLGWDESVYVSQVAPHIPSAYFSAPRSRGTSVVVAPLVLLTDSEVALRVYLAVLSGAGLFLALWVWRRLRPVPVLALAGLLFAGLWVAQIYGFQAMPNVWIALCGLAAVGCFLRAGADPADRRALVGLALSLAAAALLRPTDAVWLSLPMGVGALLVRRWRRPLLLAAVAGGLVLGSAQWIIEAYVSYGGLTARLHRSSEIQGGLGWNPAALLDQYRTLAGGPMLCRPCHAPNPNPVVAIWWFALPFAAAAGVYVSARRRREWATALLPALCGLSVAVQYLLFIGYAAPRFLLPAYALLAIPVADLLIAAARPVRLRHRPRLRLAATSLVALAVVGQLVSQQVVLRHAVHNATSGTEDYARMAAGLRSHGVRPPCLVTGSGPAIPVAYQARCRAGNLSGSNENMTRAELLATGARQPVAVLVPPGGKVPSYARHWTSHPLTGLHGRSRIGYRVFLSPATPQR
jgi:hypothetical protein